MAIGPLARMLAQIVVPVVAVLARALPAAYAQALNNARRSGAAAAASETAANSQNILRPNRISTSEALSVLNFATEDEAKSSLARIEEQYEKYMRANAVSSTPGGSGGSFYLQSKIYRAREQLLREFHQEKQQNSQEQQQQQQQQQAQNSTNGEENQSKS